MIIAASPECEIIAYGHVGDGNLHFNILPPIAMANIDKKAHLHDLEKQLFEVLDDFHGSINAEHSIGRIKQGPYLPRSSPIERELINGVKTLFDPKGMMNPGRILTECK